MVEALKREMGRPDTHVFRFVYVKGGENGEWTEHEFQPMFQRLDCFSVTKSFTATAVGIAQDEGYLSVDDPISRFFEEEWPADADEKLAPGEGPPPAHPHHGIGGGLSLRSSAVCVAGAGLAASGAGRPPAL